jgi:glyoxylase-like metal-dependent hydrolase (beta-lactamase superfamily II)
MAASLQSGTMTGPAAQIGPLATQVLPDVYSIACPFGEGGIVYVYFIDAPEAALVDTGVNASPRGAIEPALNAIGKSLADVRHLFNTHGHWDHMGGNEEVRRIAPSVTSYLHEADLHLMQTPDAHVRGYSSYAVRVMNVPGGLEQVDRLQRSSIDAPTRVDVRITDGLRVPLGAGKTVRAIHTPGHSFGSTSYLLEETGALFTGDGIQGLGSRPGQLPLVFDDSRQYRASLAKVSDLGVSALCMGHSFSGLSPESGREAVRTGRAAQTFLEESGQGAKVVEEAARSVLPEANPGDFLDFARRLFQRVSGQLGVELDEQGLSSRSMATVHAFYRELTGAPAPA